MYYNLLISGDENDWKGDPYRIELSRCISRRENTDEYICEKFSDLKNKDVVNEIMQFPCLFMYEGKREMNPKFGYITDIIVRGAFVQIEYKIVDLNKEIKLEDIAKFDFELGFHGFNIERSHWAIKGIDLDKYLSKLGLNLPLKNNIKSLIDIRKHKFDISFSFAGEYREYVSSVFKDIESQIGEHKVFYDEKYVEQLASPGLDMLLSNIYYRQSQLIVVFFGSHYNEKNWCGLELSAINAMKFEESNMFRIMYVKMDDGKVDGILPTDGYISGNRFSPTDMSSNIIKRLKLL